MYPIEDRVVNSIGTSNLPILIPIYRQLKIAEKLYSINFQKKKRREERMREERTILASSSDGK